MTCPRRKDFGDIVCIDGQLWALTYSECAPPDQRQCIGECEICNPRPMRLLIVRDDEKDLQCIPET